MSPIALYPIAVLIDGLIDGSFNLGGFRKANELPKLWWPIGWLVMIVTFGLGEETDWRGSRRHGFRRDRVLCQRH